MYMEAVFSQPDVLCCTVMHIVAPRCAVLHRVVLTGVHRAGVLAARRAGAAPRRDGRLPASRPDVERPHAPHPRRAQRAGKLARAQAPRALGRCEQDAGRGSPVSGHLPGSQARIVPALLLPLGRRAGRGTYACLFPSCSSGVADTSNVAVVAWCACRCWRSLRCRRQCSHTSLGCLTLCNYSSFGYAPSHGYDLRRGVGGTGGAEMRGL